MKNFWIFASSFTLLSFAWSGCQYKSSYTEVGAPPAPYEGALDRSVRPAPGPAPEVSFPEHAFWELESGAKLFAIASDRQPTITYRALIRSGDLFDGDKTGLSMLTAEMLERGVGGKTALELASEIDFMGASISVSPSSDFIAVSVSGLSKYKDQLRQILADLLMSPTFPGKELDKLKRQTISSLVAEREDPSEMASKLRRTLLYGSNGYGAFPTEESIASIARSDLVAFHKTHFVPNNASIAIVGDFVEKEEFMALEKTFASWMPGNVPEAPALDLPLLEENAVHIIDRPESVQTALLVAQQSERMANPDTPELRVLLSVLGGGSSGRMYQNLREDKGFTYGAWSYGAHAGRAGAIVTSTEIRNEVTGAAAREIFAELERIRTEPIAEAELARHRQYLAGNYMMSLENPATIAFRVQNIDLFGLDKDYYATYVDQLLSVTPQRALELAQTYLHPDKAIIAMVGKAEEVLPQLENFGETTLYDVYLQPLGQ